MAVGAWAGDDENVAVQGNGQDEAMIVVGVFADQVHAAGGAKERDAPLAREVAELGDGVGITLGVQARLRAVERRQLLDEGVVRRAMEGGAGALCGGWF